MTYINCKKIIDIGKEEEVKLLEKLDVFLIADRLTAEQYQELVALIMDKR